MRSSMRRVLCISLLYSLTNDSSAVIVHLRLLPMH